MRLYQFELWSRQGVFIADISDYVKSVRYSMQRNEAEQISLRLDFDGFEDFAASIGTNPTSMLSPYQTDIKVKRNDTYMFGTRVGYTESVLGETESQIDVRAFGYLNLLIDRYVTKSYQATETVEIAWDLINETQDQTNGDMGMTQGPNQTTTVNRDRTYVRQNVKEGIVNLTKLVSGNFDFEFTYDMKFNTYTSIGSDLSNTIQFIYPGEITQVRVPRNGLALFNKVYGIGSGFGDDQLTSTQSDNNSQLNYGVHERIALFNSVVLQDTLDDNTLGDVNRRKTLLEIPEMTINGTDFDLNTVGIGDTVTVRIEDRPFLNTVSGKYRIERIEVDLDENESENITLSFDNFEVEQ